MSVVENEDRKIRTNSRVFCDVVKTLLLEIFLFTRFYIDILIDRIFGYFNDSKRVPIKKCTNPIILQSATSLAKKIRKGELKSEQIVQAFIDRIKEVNPILNALVDSRYEDALEDARKIDRDIQNGTISDADFRNKPFLGVPFTTKESTAVKGLSFTLGIVKRKGRKALFDADYITSLKQAGAICLGVTNVPQLNLWMETHNPIYGITCNPYDNTRNVGGSSGGEASLLAGGGTPLSIGTDIGGSVRIPAFMCGVFGHKPSSNLISTKGATFSLVSEAQTIFVVGIFARHSVDIAPLLKVLADVNASKLKLDDNIKVENIKINYIRNPKDVLISPFRDDMKNTFNWYCLGFRTGKEKTTMVNTGPLTRHAEDLTPVLKVLVGRNVDKLKLDESVDIKKINIFYISNPKDCSVSVFRKNVKEAFLRVINHFSEISATKPEELHLDGTKYAGQLWKYWMGQESGTNFMKDITDRTGEAHPIIDTIKYFTVGNDYTLSTIFNFVNKLLPYPKDEWAIEETEKLKKQLLDKLGNNGVLLYPSAPFTAGYHHSSYLRPWNFNLFVLWNVLKFPVTQVPLGLSNGLPVGIQVVAAPYQDHLCFAVAKELEKAFGGYVVPFATT